MTSNSTSSPSIEPKPSAVPAPFADSTSAPGEPMDLLTDLIAHANAQGWRVTLEQQSRHLWLARLLRRLPNPHPDGAVNLLHTRGADSPYWALNLALTTSADAEPIEPAGISAAQGHEPPGGLLNLLGLTQPAIPSISRRI